MEPLPRLRKIKSWKLCWIETWTLWQYVGGSLEFYFSVQIVLQSPASTDQKCLFGAVCCTRLFDLFSSKCLHGQGPLHWNQSEEFQPFPSRLCTATAGFSCSAYTESELSKLTDWERWSTTVSTIFIRQYSLLILFLWRYTQNNVLSSPAPWYWNSEAKGNGS